MTNITATAFNKFNITSQTLKVILSNMQFKASLFIALGLMAPALAAPVEAAAASSPGLYLCQNSHFNERPNFCNKYTSPWGRCSKSINPHSNILIPIY